MARANLGWLVLGAQGRCLSVSTTLAEWLGVETHYLLGHGWTFYVDDGSHETIRTLVNKIQGGIEGDTVVDSVTITLRGQHHDTAPIHMRIFAAHAKHEGHYRLVGRVERTRVA